VLFLWNTRSSEGNDRLASISSVVVALPLSKGKVARMHAVKTWE